MHIYKKRVARERGFSTLLLVLVLWEELRGSFHLDCWWNNSWEWVEGGRLPRKCCVGFMIVSFFFSFFAVKGGLSGHKQIYIGIWFGRIWGALSFLHSFNCYRHLWHGWKFWCTPTTHCSVDFHLHAPPSPPSLFHFLSLWGVYFHGWIVDHTHKQIIMEKFCLTSLMNYGFCNVNLELSKVKIRVCYFSVPFNFTPISLGFCINSING